MNRIEDLSIIMARVSDDKYSNKSVYFKIHRDKEGELFDLQLVDKFTEEVDRSMESPLLMAFFNGYQFGLILIQNSSHLN
jgi:hypothetical protein